MPCDLIKKCMKYCHIWTSHELLCHLKYPSIENQNKQKNYYKGKTVFFHSFLQIRTVQSNTEKGTQWILSYTHTHTYTTLEAIWYHICTLQNRILSFGIKTHFPFIKPSLCEKGVILSWLKFLQRKYWKHHIQNLSGHFRTKRGVQFSKITSRIDHLCLWKCDL